MKILIATDKPFAKVAVDGIRKEVEDAGFELALLEKYTGKQQLLDAVTDVDAVIIRSDIIDTEVIAAAKRLKIVVRAGAGYDNVDLEAAKAAGVCVMNTPGQNSNAVAELVFGLLVFAVRNFYNGTSGTELLGKKLGIHAYGNVGRNVARIAKGFGMEMTKGRRSLVVIVGCSRMGAAIAFENSARGSYTTIIDSNPDAFHKINPEYSGFFLVGDATDQAVLDKAHIQEASQCVVATQDDSTNIYVASLVCCISEVFLIVVRLHGRSPRPPW